MKPFLPFCPLNIWMFSTITHFVTRLTCLLVKQKMPWLRYLAQLRTWHSLTAPLWITLAQEYQPYKVTSSLKAILHSEITLAPMVEPCSVKTQPCSSEMTHQFTSSTTTTYECPTITAQKMLVTPLSRSNHHIFCMVVIETLIIMPQTQHRLVYSNHSYWIGVFQYCL